MASAPSLPPLAPKGEPVDRRVGGGPLRTAVDRGDRPVDQKVGLESLTVSLFVSSYLI